MRTPTGYLFELTGGRLCLDLANTLDERPTDNPRELLPTYTDLLDWGVQAGAIGRAEAAALRDHAARHRRAASVALERIKEAREVIFRLFSAVADERGPAAEVLAAFNRMLPEALVRRCLARVDGRFAWTWRPGSSPQLDALLWPAAWSAADLLTSPELDRVRRCAGNGCAWLFIDTSRNRTRRWCDMSVCGNRAKARRHHARTKTRPDDR
jgi:predicted RNA-binding Zn ribbon-like protein